MLNGKKRVLGAALSIVILAGACIVTALAARQQKPPARQAAATGSSSVHTALPAAPVSSKPEVKRQKIILDPGHGGPDAGTTSVTGTYEKNLNLLIALKLKSELEKSGYAVIMTRDRDISIHDPDSKTLAQMKVSDLNNRIKIMQENPGAVFVSIHQNFNEDSADYSGTQVYYSENDEESIRLAKAIQSRVKEELQPDNDREVHIPEGLRVLVKAPIPAVMVECGFLSNKAEAQKLDTDAYQSALAQAIAEAIDRYFGTAS